MFVRRSTSNTNTSTPTQLQQLQMQLQLERQQVNQARQQLERFPRRQTQSQTALRESASATGGSTILASVSPAVSQQSVASAPPAPAPAPQSHFLLTGLLEEMSLQANSEQLRQDRSQFVQQLVVSTLSRRKEDDDKSDDEPPVQVSADPEPEQQKITNVSSKTSNGSSNSRILRGRARSNASNALSRADANKATLMSKKSSEDNANNDGVFR